MLEAESTDLNRYEPELHHLVKTDPDPRVQRVAQAVLLLAQGHMVHGRRDSACLDHDDSGHS